MLPSDRHFELLLEPRDAVVAVPNAEDAFELVYEFAEEKAEWKSEGFGDACPAGIYHGPRWLQISTLREGLSAAF